MPSQSREFNKQEIVTTNYKITIRPAVPRGLNDIWQITATKPHMHIIKGNLLKISITIHSV